MNTYKWLLKREFWEHRGGFFWAPIIAGIVFLVLNLGAMLVGAAAAGRAKIQIGLFELDEMLRNLDAETQAVAGAAVDATLFTVATTITFVVGVVVFFYCLGALYDERRDRSVLFWKSLPVSDRDTVLSKVLSATVVAPAIGIVAGALTGIGLLLLIATFLAFLGQNVFGILLFAGNPLKVLAMLAALLPVWALWALPTVGWLMFCSVWARSKPFLWAIAIPVGAGIMVSWFDLMRAVQLPDFWFWKTIVARALFSVFPGSWLGSDWFDRFEDVDGPHQMVEMLGMADLFAPLARADLWIGAVVGIALIVAAIRMRRWRDEG